MAVGWASTAGTLGPMGDNPFCLVAARKGGRQTLHGWKDFFLKHRVCMLRHYWTSHLYICSSPSHSCFPNPSSFPGLVLQDITLQTICVLYEYFKGTFCQRFLICLVTWSGAVTQRGRKVNFIQRKNTHNTHIYLLKLVKVEKESQINFYEFYCAKTELVWGKKLTPVPTTQIINIFM